MSNSEDTLDQIRALIGRAEAARGRFSSTYDLHDLDEAVDAWNVLLRHPVLSRLSALVRFQLLSNGGRLHLERYLITRVPHDLESALRCWQAAGDPLGQAIKEGAAEPAQFPVLLASIAGALEERYVRGRSVEDLMAAVSMWTRAVRESASDSPYLAGYLSSLGRLLYERYERQPQRETLDEAVAVWERAVETTRVGDGDLPDRLEQLAMVLGERYVRFATVEDLDLALELYADAIERMPEDAPILVRVLNNYGRLLHQRFVRSGSLEDSQRCIDTLKAALSRVPPGAPFHTQILRNLKVALDARYVVTGADQDRDRARVVGEHLAESGRARTAAGPSATESLDALSDDLISYSLYDREETIERAAELAQQVVAQTAPDSPERPWRLFRLGIALLLRYLKTHQASDLSAAIDAFEGAMSQWLLDSPHLPRFLGAYALALRLRFQLNGDTEDLGRAIETYAIAATRAAETTPGEAMSVALQWGAWASQRQAWEEAAWAYGDGLQAMTRLFQTQLQRYSKERWLARARGIAAGAAYARAQLGHLEGAVEALEAGRALLLSEALGLDRARLEGLVDMGRADLKARYEAVTGRWNQLSSTLDPVALPTDEVAAGGQALAEELRRARDELDATITDIRKVSGYERFLLSPAFTDICEDAGEDPLVYLGATEQGGLALIVRPADRSVTTQWLPELTEQALIQRVSAYRDAYQTYRASRRTPQDRAPWEDEIDDITAWLWTAAMGPLIAAVDDIPQATLIAVGLVGVLPLHAAWTADTSTALGRRYALDRLTWTYIPNARALSAARELGNRVQGERLLAVDEPAIGDGKGLKLPHSSQEVAAATATFPDAEVVRGNEATKPRVLESLAKAQIFHLSCHGRADFAQPLNSALMMARAEPSAGAEPLILGEIMGKRLNARLGVLSACETGIPGDELPDEVVSLPTGLLQAGTGGIVASLWSVPERATAMLMFRFYEAWRIEHNTPAKALRTAQRWVRDTTNKQKADHLGKAAQDQTHHMAAAASHLWRELLDVADESARDQHNPYHWAAFTYIGV